MRRKGVRPPVVYLQPRTHDDGAYDSMERTYYPVTVHLGLSPGLFSEFCDVCLVLRSIRPRHNVIST
jgi:hypothetical protein